MFKGFKQWPYHPRDGETWKAQRWVLHASDGTLGKDGKFLGPKSGCELCFDKKTSVSPLEWINCGSDSDKTSPDDSMNNSTEEEDQV